nr:DNA-binding protein [uncultured Blautia sp.]
MKSNYMMCADDVANEIGVSKGHAYKLIRQLNEELEASGYLTVSGKIPRAFWEKKFYGYQNVVQTA